MKEIYKIYASTFFIGVASAIAVINTLYFLSNGLNQAQIGTLAAIFFVCMAVLEIPTGAIADTFGHKTSVFIGLLIQSLASLFLALGSSFYLFTLAMLASGIGYAFQSGAYTSLIHDILAKLGKSDEFIKVQGRTVTALLIGSMVASPFMSLAYSQYSRLPFWISFMFLVIAAFILQLVKWEFKGSNPSITIYFQKLWKGMMLTIKKRNILVLIAISIGMGFTNSLFNQNINQPLLLNLGIDVASIGVVFAVFSAIEAVLNAYSHLIYKKLGISLSLLVMIIISAASSIILSQLNSSLGLLFILLFLLANSYRMQVIVTLLQKEVSNEERSTMLSTSSFLTYVSFGLLLPLGGRGIDLLGIKTVLFIFGPLILVIGLLSMISYKPQKESV